MTDNSLTKEALIEKGLSYIFERYRSSCVDTERLRKHVLLHPSILSDRFSSVDNHDSLEQIFKTAKKNDIDLYSIPFWKKKINAMTEAITNGGTSARSIWLGHCNYLLSAAAMVKGFDWKDLFMQMALHQSQTPYVRDPYRIALDSFSEQYPSGFKEYVEESVFFTKTKPCYGVRGFLYDRYVAAGFLSKKTARKIRSDGSEDASLQGLKSLLGNVDLYSNSDELLLQFTDSRYEQVVCQLADSLPDYLLTSIMGTEFYWAKRRIENRLEAIEAAKANEPTKEE
jgi:hypothetical protein